MAEPAFFIMGVGRSGTSILQEMLDLHPKLVVSHELRVLELALIAAATFDRAGAPPDDAPAAYSRIALLCGRAFVDALGEAQLEAAKKSGGVYADKYPPYCEQIHLLDGLYPTARFVHVVRDGRDVVASSIHAFIADRGWRRSSTVPSVAQLAAGWSRQVRIAREYGARLSRERYFEVRYEDLVERKGDALAELLAFLELERDDSVSRMAARLRPGRTWRETMSAGELAEFHKITGANSLLAELGYPPNPFDAAVVGSTIEWTRDAHSPAAWADLAANARERSDERRATFASLRAIRCAEKEPREAIALLERAKSAESLFASMCLRGDESSACRGALAEWTEARGLDRDAARAVFEIGLESPNRGVS